MSVAVITGARSGIGLATAIAFAKAGVVTVATLRNLEKAGVLLSIEPMDICDAASVERRLREVREREGRIDVLVNNAGVGGAGPLEIVPEDEHRAIFETNYWGAVHTIQAVLPDMRERGSGAIVNVSSGAGLMAVPNQVPYCASKSALEAMSESLAYELRPFGVRVILIEPGIVATSIFENAAETTHYDKASLYRTLMRRSMWLYRAGLEAPERPEAVAQLILAAIQSGDRTLRHLVGDDARKLVEGHRDVSDEEFLAMAELEDDDAYRARFKAIYDIDL